ncbi:MAG TPA: hypothetical protein DC042_00665 [Bacteroidales bacterium]|nr:hypothetical protein [Bacteroidales bacterium]
MKSTPLSFIATLLVASLLTGCGKDNGNPTIKFGTAPGLVYEDTILKVNDSIRISVEAEWNGFDQLNLLEIRLDGEKVSSQSLKTESAVFTITLVKSTLETELWEFIVSDKRANSAQVELTLSKDPGSEYGNVIEISPILLGAQNSLSKPGLFSFQSNQYFTLEQAFPNQDKIDLLLYSDNSTQSTLASPGADIPETVFAGSRNPILWNMRNLTRFLKISYTEADFNKVLTDAPILNAWSETQSVSKAATLKVGDVYLFKLQSGRKGILLVKRIIAGDDGEVEFTVRIQD